MEEETLNNEVREEEVKIEMQDLPVEVLDYLIGFLDFSTRRTCRHVSNFLKDSVDDVGISVKIDDRNSECTDLCRNVNSPEVQVQHVLDPSLNLNMTKWKTVILSGPIDSGWLESSLLRNCPNLRVLFLDRICLTSAGFGDPLLDPPTFDHLTQIHFYSRWYFKHTEKSPQLEDTEFNTRLDQNMEYLLRSVRSRVLRVLSVNVSTKKLDPHVARTADCWENKALWAFIEIHRSSLEELNGTSPEFPINGIQETYQVPTHLKQFCWNAVPPFWKNVLLAQVSLERLCLEFTQPDNIPADYLLLGTVFLNNTGTLSEIYLYFNDLDDLGLNVTVIDMTIFSNLELLRKLTIVTRGCRGLLQEYTTIVTNLNQLPRTRLTSLVLIGHMLVENFDGIRFMHGFQPQVLSLMELSTSSGPLSNQQHMWNFIRLLLRCRSLNELSLSFLTPRPEKCYVKTTRGITSYQNDGLKLWLTYLSAQGPMNYYCVNLGFMYLPLCTCCCYEFEYQQDPNFKCGNAHIDEAVHTDYLELCKRQSESGGFREQPLNLPRNVEFYRSTYDFDTDTLRIVPDPLPYLHTTRVKDIQRVFVSLRFAKEGGEEEPLSEADNWSWKDRNEINFVML